MCTTFWELTLHHRVRLLTFLMSEYDDEANSRNVVYIDTWRSITTGAYCMAGGTSKNSCPSVIMKRRTISVLV